jgi:hypothetical protein
LLSRALNNVSCAFSTNIYFAAFTSSSKSHLCTALQNWV